MSSVARAALAPPSLVTTPEQLTALLQRLKGEPVVAVDTESNSLYAYYYRVCLIQVSIPGADYLLDPLIPDLDMSPLGDIFSNPAVEKVFHAAENDILVLQRDYNFCFVRCFDTMLAARILGWRQVGLAAILDERFHVQLDKSLQRTDWGRRPLARDQMAYARLDTHYLLPLRDLLLAELRSRGRLDEAREAFAALENIAWVEKPFDPDGFWRINGARDLPPRALATLQELYLFRDAEARRQNWPPFKIATDQALINLAMTQPQDGNALSRVPRIGSTQAHRWGKGFLAAIERGRVAPPPSPPPRQGNHNGSRPDEATMTRFDALRAWRSKKAHERDVEPDVVASNEVLMTLARLCPHTPDELSRAGVWGPWKQRTYGPDILNILKDARH
ncbi:MAG: HRDC domain-containing protein [Anaerolineae bacterium]|nr:HRDC domain-containing protein [Anaerolineae bacterium]